MLAKPEFYSHMLAKPEFYSQLASNGEWLSAPPPTITAPSPCTDNLIFDPLLQTVYEVSNSCGKWRSEDGQVQV
jgi:hypothetical protein